MGGKGLIKNLLTAGILAGSLLSVPYIIQNLNSNKKSLTEKQESKDEIDKSIVFYKDSTKIAKNENESKYEKKYNPTKETLVHQIIEIQEKAKPKFLVLGSLTKDKVDSMLKRIGRYISQKPASEITKNEAKNLFIKMDSLMDDLIYKQTAECYQTALIYYAIGEHYNLPIHIVIAPPFAGEEYHSFVRWDQDGKHDPLNPENPINQGDFNWDNESKNFIKYRFIKKDRFPINDDDGYYAKEFYIPKKTIEDKIYMKNLNKNEILSLFGYWIQANIHFEKIGPALTNILEECREADIRNLPKEEYLKAIKEIHKKRLHPIYKAAMSSINKSLDLDSLCVPCNYTKSRILSDYLHNPFDDYDGSMEHIDKALSLNNEQPELWEKKGHIYDRMAFSFKESSKKERDFLIKKADESYQTAIDLVRKRIKTEFSKTDNPGGINYSKIYYLTENEGSYLFHLQLIYSEDKERYYEIGKETSEIYKKEETYKQKAHERMEKIKAQTKK